MCIDNGSMPMRCKKHTLSIKTGGCPEDCNYCSQSAKFDTGLKATKLMDVEAVLQGAQRAKDVPVPRAIAWARHGGPKDRDMDAVCEMIKACAQWG